MNPRAAINDLHPFQGCPFGQLGYFSEYVTIMKMSQHQCDVLKRRGWDSNPCALADKRFSRPPRYDHFDTSPYELTETKHLSQINAKIILPALNSNVNLFFQFFTFFYSFLIVIHEKQIFHMLHHTSYMLPPQ